jgi:hypothetical protein
MSGDTVSKDNYFAASISSKLIDGQGVEAFPFPLRGSMAQISKLAIITRQRWRMKNQSDGGKNVLRADVGLFHKAPHRSGYYESSSSIALQRDSPLLTYGPPLHLAHTSASESLQYCRETRSDIMPGMAALFRPINLQPSKDFNDFLFDLCGFLFHSVTLSL